MIFSVFRFLSQHGPAPGWSLTRLLQYFATGLSNRLLTFGPSGGPNRWPTWAMPVLIAFVTVAGIFIAIRILRRSSKIVK